MPKHPIDINVVKANIVTLIIATIAMILVPFAIIYLFEVEDFWLSICLFFYFACYGGYTGTTLSSVSAINKCPIKDDKTIHKYIKICLFLQMFLMTITLFPFALMSENFIIWINLIFNFYLNVRYEGGIIVSLLTIGCILILVQDFIFLYKSANRINT